MLTLNCHFTEYIFCNDELIFDSIVTDDYIIQSKTYDLYFYKLPQHLVAFTNEFVTRLVIWFNKQVKYDHKYNDYIRMMRYIYHAVFYRNVLTCINKPSFNFYFKIYEEKLIGADTLAEITKLIYDSIECAKVFNNYYINTYTTFSPCYMSIMNDLNLTNDVMKDDEDHFYRVSQSKDGVMNDYNTGFFDFIKRIFSCARC